MRIRRVLAMACGVPLLLAACNGDDGDNGAKEPTGETEPADEEDLDELEDGLEDLEEDEEDAAAEGLTVEDGDRDTGEFTPREPGSGFPDDAVAVGESVTVDEYDISVVSAMHGEVAVDKWLETGPPAAEEPDEGNDHVLALFEVAHVDGEPEQPGSNVYYGLVDADDGIYDPTPDPDNRYDSCPGTNTLIGIRAFESTDPGEGRLGYQCFQVPDEQVEAGGFTVFAETQATAEETGWLEVPEFDDERVLTDED